MLNKLIKSPHVLSLEFGNEFLKLVHFNRSGRGKILDVVSQDIRTMTDDDISDFLKKYQEDKKLQNIEAIVSIPARFAITKNIELPSTNQTEINDIIQLQAGRHTPYSREEIFINYIPIGVYKGGYTKVLLVIVNRDVIKKNLEIMEKAQIAAKKFLLSPEIIARWYAENAPLDKATRQSCSAIIHFDRQATDVIIVNEGNPIFVRSVPIGTVQLTEEAAEYQERFIEEIRSSFETYQAENIESLSKVFFTGAISALTGIKATLESGLNLVLEPIPYENTLNFSGGIENQAELLERFSFAAPALAPLKYKQVAIDLTPEELKIREAVAEKNRDIILAGTLAIFIMIIISAVFVEKIYVKNNYLQGLKKEYEQNHAEVVGLKEKSNKMVLLKNYLNVRPHALYTLTELFSMVPEKIHLEKITYNKLKGVIEVNGVSQEKDLLYQLEKDLEDSDYFKGVEIRKQTSQTIKEEYGLRQVTNFTIVCAFESLVRKVEE